MTDIQIWRVPCAHAEEPLLPTNPILTKSESDKTKFYRMVDLRDYEALSSKLNETALSLEASENLRRGLTDQLAKGSAQLTETLSRLQETQKYWDDEKRRYDSADKAFRQVCDERDSLSSRLRRGAEIMLAALRRSGAQLDTQDAEAWLEESVPAVEKGAQEVADDVSPGGYWRRIVPEGE